MFNLVWVRIITTSVFINIIPFQIYEFCNSGIICFYKSFGTLKGFPNLGHGPRLMPALAGYNRASWIFEFHKMMIIYFSIFRAGTYLSSSHSLGRNRIFTYEPIGNINIMYVLL